MMCDARLWEPQIKALKQDVHVADMTTADNLGDLARNVLAAAPGSFAMAGLSMGGILAFEIWRQAPGRVSHMALLDTNARPDDLNRQSAHMQQIEQAYSGRLREAAVETLKSIYLAKPNRDKEELLDTILGMALDLGPDVFRKQLLALKNRPDSVPTLATIDCPTAVICGREDALCPLSFHEFIAAKIPNARLVVIENCGHFATLEQPDTVSKELSALFMQ